MALLEVKLGFKFYSVSIMLETILTVFISLGPASNVGIGKLSYYIWLMASWSRVKLSDWVSESLSIKEAFL